MRQKKAKAMRRADPSRPNPGRKHGGAGKLPVMKLPCVEIPCPPMEEFKLGELKERKTDGR